MFNIPFSILGMKEKVTGSKSINSILVRLYLQFNENTSPGSNTEGHHDPEVKHKPHLRIYSQIQKLQVTRCFPLKIQGTDVKASMAWGLAWSLQYACVCLCKVCLESLTLTGRFLISHLNTDAVPTRFDLTNVCLQSRLRKQRLKTESTKRPTTWHLPAFNSNYWCLVFPFFPQFSLKTTSNNSSCSRKSNSSSSSQNTKQEAGHPRSGHRDIQQFPSVKIQKLRVTSSWERKKTGRKETRKANRENSRGNSCVIYLNG